MDVKEKETETEEDVEETKTEEEVEETKTEEEVEEAEEDHRTEERLDAIEEKVSQLADFVATLAISEEEEVDPEPEADEDPGEWGDAVDLDEYERILGA